MLQNIPKEKILEVVNQGPTLPAKIAKQIGSGGDTMLIGAILSTLVSSGDIKVSTLKVGGSPLYYVPDQESKLEDFVSYLNEKDRKTFKILKEQKILQDSEQDPLMRVSLRAIKDFAKQFEYDFQGQKLLCWRFYSISKEDALDLARKNFVVKPIEQSAPEVVTVVEKPVEKPVERIIEKTEPHVVITPQIQSQIHIQQVLEESEESMPKHEVHEHKTEKAHEKHAHKEHHEIHKKPHEHHEHTKKVEEIVHKDNSIEETKSEAPVVLPVFNDESKVKVTKEPKVPKAPKLEYNFYDLILNHVTSMKLDLISKEKIKKTEYDLILKNHETNEYFYCKAKDKPTISEGDLAPALIFAQNKKMPCIFMSTGELTKTAAILITREFSGIKFEKIVVSDGN